LSEPVLYTELAEWWPLLSAPADYEEAAGLYADLLSEACRPAKVLELGSGGGNNASHMKRRFQLTLVDRSAAMLRVSRRLNPECEHLEGDMRSVRLGRRFDAVFVQDAIMYLTTEEQLASALQTAVVHCRSRGAVLLAPDAFAESFRPRTSHGGHDGEDRGLRYLQWDHPPEPGATRHAVDMAYLLREGAAVRVIHDRHWLGLFPRATWLDLCRRAGLEPEIRTVLHTHEETLEAEVLLCRKP